MTSDLTWKSQTSNVHRMLGQLKRNTKSFSVGSKRLLYLAIVRPHVYYASEIYGLDINIRAISMRICARIYHKTRGKVGEATLFCKISSFHIYCFKGIILHIACKECDKSCTQL